jgi:hypothetical protein
VLLLHINQEVFISVILAQVNPIAVRTFFRYNGNQHFELANNLAFSKTSSMRLPQFAKIETLFHCTH